MHKWWLWCNAEWLVELIGRGYVIVPLNTDIFKKHLKLFYYKAKQEKASFIDKLFKRGFFVDKIGVA